MYDDAAEWDVDEVAKLRADLVTYLTSSTDIAERLSKVAPSRELSLVRTKLEEAGMWLERERG